MTRHRRINRVLARAKSRAKRRADSNPPDAPRKLGAALIDFSSLQLPRDVRYALAEAFWNLAPARAEPTVYSYWHHIKSFARFVTETRAIASLRDMRSALVLRYIEWLNKQKSDDGKPWSKGTRYSTYTSLRTLLESVQRCRPGLLKDIEFPVNPFPWKNRDVRRIGKLSASALQDILKACERDIRDSRALRSEADKELATSRASGTDSVQTRGDLLRLIDERYGGIVPSSKVIHSRGHCPLQRGLIKCGYAKRIEPCLYPRADSIFPYYLAILIHSAGNPEPICELTVDCLQPIPLLDDRELLVWSKARAGAAQRRSFPSRDACKPPAMVREILQWTRRLRSHALEGDRDRLFLYKGQNGVHALSFRMVKVLFPGFVARHHLPHFTFSSIRPSVLTAFYRASGDLREVKAIANHANLATTVGYVEGAEVESQNRARVAALQKAFIGHIENPQPTKSLASAGKSRCPSSGSPMPSGTAVSMFGFNCKDPFAGIAPGTRPGELCMNFLGCFTCPNAVITADAPSVARLLQARDHLQAANTYLHPARWEAIYASQLRILEEDILTRFSARELAAAAPLRDTLPPLPQLR